MRRLAPVAAMALLAAAAPASAAYIADFDTTGSVADFTEIYSNNVSSPAITLVNDGDNRLNVAVTATADTSSAATQLRFAAAPVGVEGAEIARPTGLLAEPVRTEARLRINVEARTASDVEPTDEYPFISWGLAAFNSATNTASYDDKLLLQISSDLANITVNRSVNNFGSGTTFATYTIPGGVAIPTPDIELQVTADQARLLYNGVALIPNSAATDWVPIGTDLSAFDGDSFIPFVGVIRGAVLEAGDTISAGFDNISATNVVVPEPASLSLVTLAGLTLPRRRRTR